ncbi:MAG: hypothetical protein ABR587_14035, partial [Candidatus Binatia bacterium]
GRRRARARSGARARGPAAPGSPSGRTAVDDDADRVAGWTHENAGRRLDLREARRRPGRRQVPCARPQGRARAGARPQENAAGRGRRLSGIPHRRRSPGARDHPGCRRPRCPCGESC